MLLPSVDAPSGSFDETKRTGSCMLGSCVLKVVHAMEWEDPHATRFTCTSSRPCTGAGLRLTMVVPLPCCPWSLSPHAYTYITQYAKCLSAIAACIHPQSKIMLTPVFPMLMTTAFLNSGHLSQNHITWNLLCPCVSPAFNFQ
jgi:hypothetical protein